MLVNHFECGYNPPSEPDSLMTILVFIYQNSLNLRPVIPRVGWVYKGSYEANIELNRYFIDAEHSDHAEADFILLNYMNLISW